MLGDQHRTVAINLHHDSSKALVNGRVTATALQFDPPRQCTWPTEQQTWKTWQPARHATQVRQILRALTACLQPTFKCTRQIHACMQYCGALLFPAQWKAAAVEACLAASISHPSVSLPLRCHACLHSHRCCCADQSLAGCTPYSLHSAEQTATGYEAKEFHLQQVHKPLPDKVSAGMRTLSCMPACASMWHWGTSCRCAAGGQHSTQACKEHRVQLVF
jgi:hypothetical protein